MRLNQMLFEQFSDFIDTLLDIEFMLERFELDFREII
jgi:hypothetical protein